MKGSLAIFKQCSQYINGLATSVCVNRNMISILPESEAQEGGFVPQELQVADRQGEPPSSPVASLKE